MGKMVVLLLAVGAAAGEHCWDKLRHQNFTLAPGEKKVVTLREPGKEPLGSLGITCFGGSVQGVNGASNPRHNITLYGEALDTMFPEDTHASLMDAFNDPVVPYPMHSYEIGHAFGECKWTITYTNNEEEEKVLFSTAIDFFF